MEGRLILRRRHDFLKAKVGFSEKPTSIKRIHRFHPEGARMKVTEVKIFPVNEERLKAYVTITLDDCFVVRDLKIIKGNGGLFVAMPSKKRKDGQFKDIAHPLNQETREYIEDEVFKAFEEEVKSMGDSLDDLKRAE